MKKIFEIMKKYKDYNNDPYFETWWDTDANKFVIVLWFHSHYSDWTIDWKKELKDFLLKKFPDWTSSKHEYPAVRECKTFTYWKMYNDWFWRFHINSKTIEMWIEFLESLIEEFYKKNK